MLYVFLVDTGTMLAFDMNLAVECVSQLKEVIARACRISEDKQVLLISGGESLDPNTRVCSYSAGTDTNPIFLFSKSTIESSVPPSPSIDYGSESDLKEQVDGSLNLPPTYMTVVARAQLAQQFYDVAKEQTRLCERLVHDQHLQQQGWAAVVANLEDITSAFKTRTEVFEQNFRVYLESRDQYVDLLRNFGDDRELLRRIPVLRTLLRTTEDIIVDRDVETRVHNSEEEVGGEERLRGNGVENLSVVDMSLLQWISSKDQQSSLEGMAEQCNRGLDQFDGEMYDGLCSEIQKTLESVDNSSMKEVKGLEDRLYGLEQLMHEARKLVQEQCDLAQAFIQNQTRAGNLGDVSVLPDLCASHRKQLMVMLQNHKQLQDIRRRCIRAKEELSVNLHARLRWIMYVERAMSDVDSKLVIYHENLKRLKRHLEVIQQIHLAPRVYFAFVVEVVRRRSFSFNFLQWSRALSNNATELYNKEVATRKEFLSKIGNHFLYALFPGLDDFPPPYALHAPAEFDNELPNIQLSDVDALRESLPEMASSLTVPAVDNMPSGGIIENEGFSCHSSTIKGVTGSNALRKQVSPVIGSTLESEQLDGVPSSSGSCATTVVPSAGEVTLMDSPRDGKDHEESEPDTEEFEKVEGGAMVIEQGDVLEEEAEVQRLQSDNGNPRRSIPLTAPYRKPSVPIPSLVCVSPHPIPNLPFTNQNDDVEGPPPDESSGAYVSSQDFFTADFYIDESMPSSYTESNGTGGVPIAGGTRNHMVKTHHVIVAELQHRLDEKGSAITLLQEEMSQSRIRIHQLEEKLKRLQALESETVAKLRKDVADTREFVLHSRNTFLCHVVALSEQVTEVTEIVRERVCSENDSKLREALSVAKDEHVNVVAEICRQLELESSKLRDACLEVERYQDQLQQGNEMLDSLKAEITTQLEEQRQRLDDERSDIVKSMTLEHELELENLREFQRKEDDEREEKLRQLQEELRKQEKEFAELTSRYSSMEEVMAQKYQTEKEELMRIVEERNMEQEKRAVKEAVEDAESRHLKDLERHQLEIDERVASACEELRVALIGEFESAREREEMKWQSELQAEVERSRRELTETLGKQHKQEMETLRARCRFAFTSTMERSPSDSSLEKIERPDSADPSRIEQQMTQLRHELQECGAALEDLRQQNRQLQFEKETAARTMQASFTAQKQIVFNEAISRATSEKDRIITELRGRLRVAETELEREQELNAQLRMSSSLPPSPSSPSEKETGGPYSLPTQKSPMDSEPFQMISPSDQSDMPLEASVAISPIQEQSTIALETALNESTSAAGVQMQTAKVSVFSCNIGDLVLFFFEEKHGHYVKLSMGSTCHFLNSDCLDALSLAPFRGEFRKPWTLGEITEKEYCEAKKWPNRYRVPIGTRFYRVRAKPWIVPKKDPATGRRTKSESATRNN